MIRTNNAKNTDLICLDVFWHFCISVKTSLKYVLEALMEGEQKNESLRIFWGIFEDQENCDFFWGEMSRERKRRRKT